MEDPNIQTTNPETTEPTERTFTQAQLDAIVAREKAKATKGMFSADDMSAKDESIKTLTGERDTAQADLKAAREELESIKHKQVLHKYGVPEEDEDYYAFKIQKLVTDKKPFDKAAEEFFKDKQVGARFVSTGGSVGGNGSASKNANDQMNALIRGAYK